MRLPYRTQRKLIRAGTILAAVVTVGALAWLCWVIWLERYVVYSGSTASLDFSVSAQDLSGEVARPPVAEENVPIYYNEGSDALDISSDLPQLSGYYITISDLKNELDTILTTIQRLDAGTAVMVELKDGYGNFFYNSKLSGVPIVSYADKVEQLLAAMEKRGLYLIAKVSALPDYTFVVNNPSACLKKGQYGWLDPSGYYWLDPTNATTVTWLTTVIQDLKEWGFDEVVLGDYRFPSSTEYAFTGDKTLALQETATKLITATSASDFCLSFAVEDPALLEIAAESRCRMYLTGVDASGLESTVGKAKVADPQLQLAFIAETNDTRFDAYSILRPIGMSEIIEGQKQG